MIGNMVSDSNSDLHKLAEWDQEARITSMKMWRNKVGDGIGKIVFTLSTGNTFDVGDQTSGDAIPIVSAPFSALSEVLNLLKSYRMSSAAFC